MNLDDVTVIIPALNEERSLALVLGDLPEVGNVILVDNGSTDGTAEVAVRCGAQVVHEPRRGYGSACLAGLAHLRRGVDSGKPAPRVVAFVDADYSDHPEQLPQLVEPILNGQVDFVLGSRLAGQREPGAMPPQSVYGNRFACWLMWRLWGVRFSDLGPFRAIDFNRLVELDMVDADFGWTIEMQIKAARRRLRILEVPVDYRRRVGASKISGTVTGTVKAGGKILYTVAKYGLQRDTKHRAPDDTCQVADTDRPCVLTSAATDGVAR